MEKKKAVFVTGLLAVMFVLIIIGLYKLFLIGFWTVVGMLALYGFASCALAFYDWLRKSEDKLEPVWAEEPSEDFVATYDQIKEELRREEA